MPSPENEPNLDKLERKKKKSSSGKSGTPKGVPTPNPGVINKMAQDIGEELIRDLQEKDGQDRRSRSKKTKKDSDREVEKVAQKRRRRNGNRKRKRKGKRKLKNERKKRSRKQRNGLKRSNWLPIRGQPGRSSFTLPG